MPEPGVIAGFVLLLSPLGLLAALVLFLVVADEKKSLAENFGSIATFCLLMASIYLSFLT